MTTPAESLDGWLPIRVHKRGEPAVEWCWLDGVPFSEPFFAETLELAMRHPFRLLFRQETSIAALDRLEPGRAPSGFVLHGSRCGSTLVAQMLAALPDSLVLSEPPPVDHVLRAQGTEAERVHWLRGIVSALGRPRLGAGRPYVLKLDAWATCNLPTLRSAFPEVPWVFLYREPVQVLVSQFGQRGAHMVPGVLDPGLFGLDPASVTRMAPEEYCARVLAAIYRAALDHRDGLAHFVDYGELPDAVFSRILDAFGLDYDERTGARMRELAGLDAKNPHLLFTAEGEPTDREAPAALREAADRWVRPVYEELLAC